MSEGDRMGNIARWELSDCPDCGCLTGATADQIAWCDEHCASDKTLVEVVRADAYRGAVSALREIQRQTPRLPATDPVTGEPSPWTIAADYFTDFGGQ